MQFPFNELAATQAAATLLRLSDSRRLDYGWLLAVTYLADRRALIETGEVFVGSVFVKRRNGPVSIIVYDAIIWGRPIWSKYIRTEGMSLELVQDPGDGELSDYQVELLEELYRSHKTRSLSEMSRLLQALPEWRSPVEPVELLRPEEILRAAGVSEVQILEYQEHNSYILSVDEFRTRPG